MALLCLPWALSHIPCARTRARGGAACCMMAAIVCQGLSVSRRTYRAIITPEVSVAAAQALHTMHLGWGRYLTKKFLLQHLDHAANLAEAQLEFGRTPWGHVQVKEHGDLGL